MAAEKYTTEELNQLLVDAGLSTSGTKKEKEARIEEAGLGTVFHPNTFHARFDDAKPKDLGPVEDGPAPHTVATIPGAVPTTDTTP